MTLGRLPARLSSLLGNLAALFWSEIRGACASPLGLLRGRGVERARAVRAFNAGHLLGHHFRLGDDAGAFAAGALATVQCAFADCDLFRVASLRSFLLQLLDLPVSHLNRHVHHLCA